MSQPLQAPVSVFCGSTNTTPVEQIPLETMLTRIQTGTYRRPVDTLRRIYASGDATHYRREKEQSVAFTPCCALQTRDKDVPWPDKLLSITGLVHLDLDHLADAAALKALLAQDCHVVFAFISPNGAGLKIGIAVDGITNPGEYRHAWVTVLDALKRTYPAVHFNEDLHVKFLHALCYVSYDPALYANDQAETFLIPPPTPKGPAMRHQSSSTPDYDRVGSALACIPNQDAAYDTWLTLGMALHQTNESWARGLWDDWSQQSTKFDARKQAASWQSFASDGSVTIASLFHLAQQHGWSPPPRANLHVSANGSTPQGAQQTSPPAAAAQMWGTPGQVVPPPLPDIFLNTEMTRIVDETQAALLALPQAPIIYQRARHLTVISWDVRPPKWLHRPHDMPVMLDASTTRLTELASQAAHYWKYDKRTKKWDAALPAGWVIDTLTSRPGWPFPLLEGIVSSPTLRPDGSVLAMPGYDVETGLYLDTNGTTFSPLLAHPTLDDARSATGALQEAVQDFPFAEPWHFSATVAAMCSLVCRFAVMGCVPLFAIRANTRGSGKSLLADVISIVGTGRAAPRWPQVTEEEEERKRLLTVALAGYPCLHIDNVTRPLGSPALDMALTAASFSDRILGTHESREAPLSMVWLASGNNMLFKGDTARRIVPIDLDAKMEKPEERTGFHYEPLLPWVRQERPRLAIAALTLVQAFFGAGCPHQGLTQLGSFEEWSAIIRHALVWAGEADPCEGRKDLEAESNPEYEQLALLLEAWAQCYPQNDAWTLAQVKADIQTRATVAPQPPNQWNVLQEALGACDPKYDGKTLNTKALGYAFRKFQRRTIGRQRLAVAGKLHQAQLWAIEHV